MAEFAGLDNWGLQAVVGGSHCGFMSNNSSAIDGNPLFFFGSSVPNGGDHQDFPFASPHHFDAKAALSDELEELYKPFYSLSDPNPLPSETVVSSSSVSLPVDVKEDVQETQAHSGQSTCSANLSTTNGYVPKYRKRKNQLKREVIEATSESLSSDMWAWRKYGQKPIKGSPYPRSYYRCSSSKACLARKQVEQSCSKPGIFIITYTAEHNHSKPTRRNSLAGTSRQKFPTTSKTQSGGAYNTTGNTTSPNACSPSSCPVSSPVPLFGSAEEEFFQARIIKQEGIDMEEEQPIHHHSYSNDILMSDDMLQDDFFAGLDDLDGFISELGFGRSSSSQCPMTSCSL